MFISVVIINWNSGNFLRDCLDSLRRSIKPDSLKIEILVFDNASTDASQQCAVHAEDVRFIQCDSNIGFARANNQVVFDHALGEWILFVNPDVIVDVNCLALLAEQATKHALYDSFGATLLNFYDRNCLDGAGDVYHASGLAWRDGHGQSLGSKVLHYKPYEVFAVCAATWLIKRSVFVECKGFDENFFCYQEDVDLAFRLRLKRYRCLQIPSAFAFHVGSQSSGGKHSDFSVYHGHRNMVWCFVKNMPSWLFWGSLPFHFAMSFFALFYFSFKKQGHIIRLAKWHALKELPRVWQQRKLTQETRIASVSEIFFALDTRLWPFGFKSLRAKSGVEFQFNIKK